MQVIRTLAKHLDAFVNNTPQQIPSILQDPQRVLTNLPDIQRVIVAVPTPLANNPTAPRVLKKKQQTYQQTTRHNTPGSLPPIVWTQFQPPLPLFTKIKTTVPTISTQPTTALQLLDNQTA
jgi:hypothetical protein